MKNEITLRKKRGVYEDGNTNPILCMSDMRRIFGVTDEVIFAKARSKPFPGSRAVEISPSADPSYYWWDWRLPLSEQPRGRWKPLGLNTAEWLATHFKFALGKPRTLHVSFTPVEKQ